MRISAEKREEYSVISMETKKWLKQSCLFAIGDGKRKTVHCRLLHNIKHVFFPDIAAQRRMTFASAQFGSFVREWQFRVNGLEAMLASIDCTESKIAIQQMLAIEKLIGASKNDHCILNGALVSVRFFEGTCRADVDWKAIGMQPGQVRYGMIALFEGYMKPRRKFDLLIHI
jgi:hypothetical protein